MTIRFVLALFLAGCAAQAQPIETKDTRESQLDPPPTDDSGEWAYIVIPNDRDYDAVASITGSSHDPKEMPAGEIGTPEPPPDASQPPEKVRIKKCGADPDCASPRVCLRPTGGPYPFGVCGEAIDTTGKPTPNRVVRACSVALPCPAGTGCVLAYGDYGMCFAAPPKNATAP